ncbi:membrane protein insertase YidC [Virgibacillus siamensis]|uniref:membrane protein insertase YidC n=1 Tax=Virgibacillus siamensis TaxID=480071 RepID=UPI0009845A5A|nr:membrane protein insertase YidC [Virgibacillus siamensis]
MEKKSVFTFIKKYSLIGAFLLLLLTGCATNEPIDPDSANFFESYFILPFSIFIKYVATLFSGNFGLSIIVITLLIRLAIMPFMLKQMKTSREMQEKMKLMKPEMDAITEKYKGKNDTESKIEKQQEMQKLYQKHQLNPLSSMGCLPMLIQFPILIGFYYAIRRTPEIAAHNFLWFNLGHTDLILTALAVLIYFVQARVSLIGMDEKQRKQMAIFSFISPIMIGFVSLNAPAALPLYWAVGGLFLIFQTIISKKTVLAQ